MSPEVSSVLSLIIGFALATAGHWITLRERRAPARNLLFETRFKMASEIAQEMANIIQDIYIATIEADKTGGAVTAGLRPVEIRLRKLFALNFGGTLILSDESVSGVIEFTQRCEEFMQLIKDKEEDVRVGEIKDVRDLSRKIADEMGKLHILAFEAISMLRKSVGIEPLNADLVKVIGKSDSHTANI